MRIRASLGVLICCCAGLTACTAAPKGPAATVTTPSVRRPPAPVSAQAALSTEAFTPYAGLAAAPADGLAPGETYAALHTACMDDAGYGQYANGTVFPVRTNRGLAFAQPYGPWGYVGISLAEQYGFNLPGSGPQPSGSGQPPGSPSSLPPGAQAAAGKCSNIVAEFNDVQLATSMAGIETMNEDISTDTIQDPAFKQATKAWSACMARNGYTTPDASTFWEREAIALGLRPPPSGSPSAPPSPPTAAQNSAQVAMAVTDADCTRSSDLAGIYFAVQASYEQQFVTASQQALDAAVRQFKANYAKELSKLPALLRTTSATPDLPGPAHAGGPAPAGKHSHPAGS